MRFESRSRANAQTLHRALLFGTERYALPILAPLAAALAARGIERRWFLPGVDAAPAGEPLLAHAAHARAFAPDVVLCAANWVPPFVPGLKAQLFHGFSVDKRSESAGHYRIRGLFDLYCTQGPATTQRFDQLAREHGHFRVTETGWPKLDPLFAAHDAHAEALRARARGRPLVAFGSTFTPRLAAAPHVYDEIARLVARGEWHWLLTLHPKSDPALVARYRALAGEHATFVETEQLVALLRAADVLVGDTSSIVSEFVVQRRPVVTFRHRAPRAHMLDIAEPAQLENAIRTALAPPSELQREIDAYAHAIHPYRDGCSSERVLDACASALARGREGLRRKPLNLWRRVQVRAKLHYWRP